MNECRGGGRERLESQEDDGGQGVGVGSEGVGERVDRLKGRPWRSLWVGPRAVTPSSV